MKFELLPNEILIECFEYLNIFDIFHSFDQLNYRFYKLIRNIPLHLNFQHIRKTKFDKFCRKMLPDIKQQIYSLCLSNKDTCGQIKVFLSHFSPNEFSHLHSLTLIQVEKENLIQLNLLLPSLSELYSFHLISSKIDEDAIVSVFPISNLRKLSLLTLRSFLIYIQQPTLITHLTIFNCSLEQLLYHLLHYVPLLKYLNIEHVTKYNRSIMNNTIINAIHLKQLIIGKFNYTFKDFENFVKQTPNLQSLTISADGDIEMVNANQWKHLIECSLLYLKIFKFKFSVDHKYNELVRSTSKQFQKKFWIKKHHWYTQMIISKKPLCFYSLPYLPNTFNLEPNMNVISNRFVDISNGFDNVTDLTLCREQIKDKSRRFHFSNIISLKLVNSAQEINDSLTPIQCIEILKVIVNLSNLKHLDISTYQRVILSGELLEILKQSPQLSSITIDRNDLILLYNDNELCKYLNKMIKKLNIYKYAHYSFVNHDKLIKFCEIFSNIEQLTCSIKHRDHVIILLDGCKLSKLSAIHIYLSSFLNRTDFRFLLEEISDRQNFIFRMKGTNVNKPELFFWIDKNLN